MTRKITNGEGTASRNTGRLQFPEQWNKSEAGPGVGDKERLTKSDSEFCQICDAKKKQVKDSSVAKILRDTKHWFG